jgi:hypothetical protein
MEKSRSCRRFQVSSIDVQRNKRNRQNIVAHGGIKTLLLRGETLNWDCRVERRPT